MSSREEEIDAGESNWNLLVLREHVDDGVTYLLFIVGF